MAAAAPTVSERASLKTELDSLINEVLESAARDNDTRNRKFVAQQYIRTKNTLKRLYEESPDDSEVNLAHQIMLVLTGHQTTSHPISHLFRPITEEADKSLFEPLLDTLMDCTYSFPYRCFVAFFWGPTPPSSYTMMIKGLQALKTPALQVLNSAVADGRYTLEAFHPKVQDEMKEALAASGPCHATTASTTATVFSSSLSTQVDNLLDKVLLDALESDDTRKHEFVSMQYGNLKTDLEATGAEKLGDEILAQQILLALTGHQTTSHPISHLFRPTTKEADKSLFEPLLDILMDCTYSFPYKCFVAFFWGPTPPSSYTMMIKGLQALKTPALQVLNSAVADGRYTLEAFHPKVQAEMKEALAASGPSGKATARAATAFSTTLPTVPEENGTSSASDKASASGLSIG